MERLLSLCVEFKMMTVTCKLLEWNILLMLFILFAPNAICILDFWRENRRRRAAFFVPMCFSCALHIEGVYSEQVPRMCYRNTVAVS